MLVDVLCELVEVVLVDGPCPLYLLFWHLIGEVAQVLGAGGTCAGVGSRDLDLCRLPEVPGSSSGSALARKDVLDHAIWTVVVVPSRGG